MEVPASALAKLAEARHIRQAAYPLSFDLQGAQLSDTLLGLTIGVAVCVDRIREVDQDLAGRAWHAERDFGRAIPVVCQRKLVFAIGPGELQRSDWIT
jgi:hypothetical protein